MYRPFVYILKHKKTRQIYIGSRTASGASPSELGRTYFSSSKIVCGIINNEGVESFQYRVLKIFKTKKETLNFEYKLLNKYNVKNNNKFINLSNGDIYGFGVPKGSKTIYNIMTNKITRFNDNEFDSEIQQNPLVMGRVFNNIIQMYVYIGRDSPKRYVILNQRLCSHLINHLGRNRYTKKIYKLKASEFKDIEFLMSFIDLLYNPFDYDIFGFIDDAIEYMSWEKQMKGKSSAFKRSAKGFRQTGETRKKMSNSNPSNKGKDIYYDFIEDRLIYLDPLIGDNNSRYTRGGKKGMNKGIHKNTYYAHNPETGKNIRCIKGEHLPDGFIKGRYDNPAGVGFAIANDKNNINVRSVKTLKCFNISREEAQNRNDIVHVKTKDIIYYNQRYYANVSSIEPDRNIPRREYLKRNGMKRIPLQQLNINIRQNMEIEWNNMKLKA